LIDPAIIDALVASGCTAEQLAAAMKADAALEMAKVEAKKAKGRARFHRWKETHSNAGKRAQTLAADSNALTRVEDKTLTTDIEPQEVKNSAPASPSPRQHLETVLDAERAEAVLQHRKSIKAPLTQRSAKLLAKELGKCADPNAAADMMMLRGWRGFEASWLTSPPRAGPNVAKINPTLVAARNLMDQLNAVTPSEIEGHQPAPRLVAIGGRGGG
jgi:hypothetical protein